MICVVPVSTGKVVRKCGTLGVRRRTNLFVMFGFGMKNAYTCATCWLGRSLTCDVAVRFSVTLQPSEAATAVVGTRWNRVFGADGFSIDRLKSVARSPAKLR